MLNSYNNEMLAPPQYGGGGIDPRLWDIYFGGAGPSHMLNNLPDTMHIAGTGAPVATPTTTPVPAVPTATPVVTPPAPTVESMRSQFLREADAKFGSNYGSRAISSSLLDDTINSILNEQRNEAQSYLDRGKARGIYNDIGYNAGAASIGNAALAGQSRIRGLSDDLISGYRSNANAVRDRAYEAIGGVTPDRAFSLDPYIAEADEVVGRAQQNAAGDLRNSLGGTKLFDFSALNNKAGQAQGALNMRDTDVATALAERRRVNSQTRGLGSTGAF